MLWKGNSVWFKLSPTGLKDIVHLYQDSIFRNWVIPENIHTIPRAASWNSEGEGGFLGLEFRRRGGVTQFGIPKAWGGVSALNSVNFQRKDGESSA